MGTLPLEMLSTLIELDPGHTYLLRNLKDSGRTELSFYKDPEIHGFPGWRGPSTQEVLRACIKRVQYLDSERRWEGNDDIVRHLRMAIGLFENRALLRKIEKGLAIEDLPIGEDGHV